MATIKDLKKELEKLGIDYPADATKQELEALLSGDKLEENENATDEEADEEEDDEERLSPETQPKTPDEVNEFRGSNADYLKKYQYKQNCKLGSDETNPDRGSKAEKMKKTLLAQPRVRIIINKEAGEVGNAVQSVCLNGYRLDFPKNVYIEVPEQIAIKLSESFQQREEALAMNRIDGNSNKEGALL